MSIENEKPKVEEGGAVVDDAELIKDGKHPETVSWNQYVGVKESLGKKLDAATSKVTSLEEQLKTAIKPEDHQRIKAELDSEKASKKALADELTQIKEASVTDKRNLLIKSGLPEEKVKTLSGDALNAAVMVAEGLGGRKPGPDMGGGGGSGTLTGSPMELARQAYSKK